jgi:hypothetical protein
MERWSWRGVEAAWAAAAAPQWAAIQASDASVRAGGVVGEAGAGGFAASRNERFPSVCVESTHQLAPGDDRANPTRGGDDEECSRCRAGEERRRRVTECKQTGRWGTGFSHRQHDGPSLEVNW